MHHTRGTVISFNALMFLHQFCVVQTTTFSLEKFFLSKPLNSSLILSSNHIICFMYFSIAILLKNCITYNFCLVINVNTFKGSFRALPEGQRSCDWFCGWIWNLKKKLMSVNWISFSITAQRVLTVLTMNYRSAGIQAQTGSGTGPVAPRPIHLCN